MDFNSLDAQREAGLNYIASQKAEGWISDKIFKGRRAPVNAIFMALTAVAIVVYWLNPKGCPTIDMIALFAIGFLIYGPVMLIGLQAFLKAPNSYRMKFAIMWANHDIDDLWDKTVRYKCKDPNGFRNIRAKADVSLDEFKNVLVPRWIEFFKKPNYYKVNGKPLFQIFVSTSPVNFFGSKETTTEAFKYFEQKVIEAGFPGIEFQGRGTHLRNEKEKFDAIGYDGVFFYNWLSLEEFSGSYYLDYSNKPDMDYTEWGEKAFKKLDEHVKRFKQYQFYPNVTCGWDTNPRFPADVYTPVALNNTPERFEYFLRKAKDWVDKNVSPDKPKLILINSLNEWTEGSYIEPDTIYGYGFLNALSNVFNPTTK